MKSDHYYIFRISIIKSLKMLQQFNQAIIIMKENLILIRDPKTFYTDFDWSKDVEKNLKPEIKLIIKPANP